MTLNLRHTQARDVVLQLVTRCDAVVENFRPGQLEKWGIGPDELAKARPGLTVVRISGYGQTGPEAGKASFGVIGEAKGGLRYLTGYPKGTTDLPPPRTGVSLGDSVAGLYGAVGALAAILEQRASGRTAPRVIDVALGEAVLTLMEGVLPEYALTGSIREPMGSGMTSSAPTSAYPCRDGLWVLIAANSDPLFRALAAVMGRPELADDPRFRDNPSRLAHVGELDRLIGAWTAAQPIDGLMRALEAADVPASKVYTVADIASDRQYRARRMVTEVADPLLGTLLHPGVVPLVEGLDRDAQIRWPGPEVGAHNGEVYGGLLGMSADRIADLRAKGVL